MSYRLQLEAIKASGHLAARKLGLRLPWWLVSRKRVEEDFHDIVVYTQKIHELLTEALASLAEHDPDRAVEISQDLYALTTKTLYNEYWKEEDA